MLERRLFIFIHFFFFFFFFPSESANTRPTTSEPTDIFRAALYHRSHCLFILHFFFFFFFHYFVVCFNLSETETDQTTSLPVNNAKHFRHWWIWWKKAHIACLSLLTLTYPNQMRKVLLFMFSKMADETNLISKLPVADRTREVWGRKLCWWCLSFGFPLLTFLFGFIDSVCFVFTSTPSYEASPLCSILCNLFQWLFWYLKSLREALRVSLYRFFRPPWDRFSTRTSS